MILHTLIRLFNQYVYCLDDRTVKRHFSGNRCSDQLVFLNAFMQWDSSNDNCISEDNGFYEEYGLSTSGLKNTSSIKVSY